MKEIDFDKIKDETIQKMQSKFDDDSIGNFIQQIVHVSAATTELMLKKYHEEIRKDD